MTIRTILSRKRVLVLVGISIFALILSSVIALRKACYISIIDTQRSVSTENAIPTQDFINGLGFGLNPWDSPVPFDVVANMLQELGIRMVRTEIRMPYNVHNSTNSPWVNNLKLLNSKGIKTLAITSSRDIIPSTDVGNYINASQGAITEVEGPNEIDAQCFPGGIEFTNSIYALCPRDIWLPIAERLSVDLKSYLKSTSGLSGIKILSPSITHNNYDIGSNIFAENSDFGNLHYYPYWAGEGTISLQQDISNAKSLYGDKSLYLTEVGYPSAPLSEFNINYDRPADTYWQSRYLPTYYLESARLGIRKTFIYDFVDPSPELPWGVVDSNGIKKPAYFALKNLISIIQDSDKAFTPESLIIEVEQKLSLTQISKILLQKADGSFYLALWQTHLSGSPTQLPGSIVPPVNIDLTFSRSFAVIKKFSPVDGNEASELATATNKLLNLSVGDKPLIIQLVGATASNPDNNLGGERVDDSSAQKNNSSPAAPNTRRPNSPISGVTPNGNETTQAQPKQKQYSAIKHITDIIGCDI